MAAVERHRVLIEAFEFVQPTVLLKPIVRSTGDLRYVIEAAATLADYSGGDVFSVDEDSMPEGDHRFRRRSEPFPVVSEIEGTWYAVTIKEEDELPISRTDPDVSGGPRSKIAHHGSPANETNGSIDLVRIEDCLQCGCAPIVHDDDFKCNGGILFDLNSYAGHRIYELIVLIESRDHNGYTSFVIQRSWISRIRAELVRVYCYHSSPYRLLPHCQCLGVLLIQSNAPHNRLVMERSGITSPS